MWEEAYEAHWWMTRYPGMTPDKVDELPAFIKVRIPLIAEVVDEHLEQERNRG